MPSEFLWTVVGIAAAILLLSPWSLRQIRGFDEKNRARIAAERSDRRDDKAHIRHTLSLAEEQVEDVSSVTLPDPRTGTPVTRWLFEGEEFFSEAEAQAMRAEKLRAIAVGFYRELPAALAARKDDDRIKNN